MPDLPSCYRCKRQPCECKDGITLYWGDCRDILPLLEPGSVTAIPTDPPYELAFMNKPWDQRGVAFDPKTWHAVLRVAMSGAMMLAFGGTRTHHRLMCAVEDAGFEIRDCLMWLYGSGFPKSLDISKAIDKAAGAERQVVGPDLQAARRNKTTSKKGNHLRPGNYVFDVDPCYQTAPATDAAKLWEGWGTALKPAWESIVCAQKPLTDNGERCIIVENLTRLEAQLWSLLPVNVAEKALQLSPAEHHAACDSALWSAEEKSNTRDALCALTDTSQFVSVTITSLSIVSWWRNILAANYGQTNTSTIETGIEPTIDWKTLKSCVLALTPLCIIQAELEAPGSRLNAVPAARYLNAVCLNISSIRELSVLGGAISKGHTSRPDDLGLVPSWEPILLAMKPLDGTFAENAVRHGVAGLNVDGCRIKHADANDAALHAKNCEPWAEWSRGDSILAERKGMATPGRVAPLTASNQGRFPANLVLSHAEGCRRVGVKKVKGSAPQGKKGNWADGKTSYQGGFKKKGVAQTYASPDGTEEVEAWECVEGCPVKMLDEQSGELKSGGAIAHRSDHAGFEGKSFASRGKVSMRATLGDSGTASRFFYQAKASRSEREKGLRGRVRCVKCGGLDSKIHVARGRDLYHIDKAGQNGVPSVEDIREAWAVYKKRKGKTPEWRLVNCVRNNHPTIKPLGLMRYLVRLTKTPFGGTVLDPFMGSGTTGVACIQEGRPFIGIEQDEESFKIAVARIEAELEKHKGNGKPRQLEMSFA